MIYYTIGNVYGSDNMYIVNEMTNCAARLQENDELSEFWYTQIKIVEEDDYYILDGGIATKTEPKDSVLGDWLTESIRIYKLRKDMENENGL